MSVPLIEMHARVSRAARVPAPLCRYCDTPAVASALTRINAVGGPGCILAGLGCRPAGKQNTKGKPRATIEDPEGAAYKKKMMGALSHAMPALRTH